jgi:hypothetical protein
MPDDFTSLSDVGRQFSDPDFLRTINAIPTDDREAFAADPAAWLSTAGYPVPEGLTVTVELKTAEQAPTGVHENVKFKVCIGPPWAQICYAHGPGEH